MDLHTTPLLTAREASRHLKMPESTLDLWTAGKDGRPPLVHALTPERRGWPRLPFVAIIEAYVLRSLRELHAPMPDIYLAAKVVRDEFGDDYALARERIATDGVALFVELADRSLVHVRGNQYGIREVLDDYLRFITWDDGATGSLAPSSVPSASRSDHRPAVRLGAPVLATSKVPV